ncbi:protein moxZ [Paracoccus shanxieyensis]|uniref:Protein moxZ n=1 Tax=Paracoccus shanxieyensis TaxID=2675752 RepID=A0A6L6J073_9RHOB|nr:protein moxZ [Paracoccus shanxieyensis]MTH64057.1 protein moxZ [Paracoccus shanxieyensis]MTH86902.1 protein moxZ [Paracoccus shanxieyensis]
MRFRPCVALGRYAVSAAILLALSACYEEEDQTIPSDTDAQVAPAPEAHWLEVGDPRAPETFLAEETGLPPAPLAAQLADLAAQYRESPRMIANRVLQLSREYPDTPLERMMRDLLPREGLPERSLGPVAQQYRVLRAGGADHATAMSAALGDSG